MDVSLFKDLVDLARNGYKPSDVKELITMMKGRTGQEGRS